MQALSETEGEITPKLTTSEAGNTKIDRVNVNESSFRWHLNENQMASFKLGEGIRLFNKDMLKLKDLIKSKL